MDSSICVPYRAPTCNLRFRRALLYAVELMVLLKRLNPVRKSLICVREITR